MLRWLLPFTAIAALCVTGSAQGLTLALQDDRLQNCPIDQIDERIKVIADAGARFTRVDVDWRGVAPTRPVNGANHTDAAYEWERYDTIARELRKRGITAIFNVYHTPEWASPTRRINAIPRAGDYADFVKALVHRYSGTQGLPRIAMFEAWNEPNIRWFLTPQWIKRSGKWYPAATNAYIKMLVALDEARDMHSPSAKILGVSGAGTTRTIYPTPEWPEGRTVGIKEFIAAIGRAKAPMDYVSQHIYPTGDPYSSRAFLSFGGLTRYAKEADKIRKNIPIWVTEFGYTTTPTEVRPTHVPEAQQAANMGPALEVMSRNPRIQGAVWFQTQDNGSWTSGLTRMDGTKKPSWAEFQRLAPMYR